VNHPLGPEKTITPPIPAGAQRILHNKGKASRGKGWWRTGTDKLASYGLDTEVWISQDSTIPYASILALEELFQTKSEKDHPDMRSDGVESILWAGTESVLMDIYNFPGVIYTTNGSKSSTGMGAVASTNAIPREADAAGWVEAPGRRRIVRQGRIRGSMPGSRGLFHPRSTHCGPYIL